MIIATLHNRRYNPDIMSMNPYRMSTLKLLALVILLLALPSAKAFLISELPPRRISNASPRNYLGFGLKPSTVSMLSVSKGETSEDGDVSPSEKIQTMATFLVSQLLEKTLQEVAKGDKSKIKEEDLMGGCTSALLWLLMGGGGFVDKVSTSLVVAVDEWLSMGVTVLFVGGSDFG